MGRARARVKICCIADPDEVVMAIRCGASAVGLVSRMPSGPGVIPESTIAAIIRGVPPGIATFLLTAQRDAEAIIDQQRRCRASVLQLVDRVDISVYRALRAALPGVQIVQVIHVADGSAIDVAERVAGEVDAILLDSGVPEAATPELGGTGRVHDWNVSAELCRRVRRPVYLAGGLRPENVAEALHRVRPFGVDVCSGVRTEGRLDPEKLARFMAAVAEG